MNDQNLIVESNLSVAWARAFLHVLDHPDADCITMCLRGFSGLPAEDPAIASVLDEKLRANDPPVPTIAQTALTIVPYQRWCREGRPPFATLRKWYLDQYLPRLKARCAKNKHGTYFERLTRFTGVKIVDGIEQRKDVDQISFVIDLWKKQEKKHRRPRQSALQLACFDPVKDHTGAALAGFPCLQQVSLTYGEAGTLGLTAYYPTQYLFDRAYGNYLGLCQLGSVIAHELGLKFTRFSCFVANPELGSSTKAGLSSLETVIRRKLKSNDWQQAA